MKTDILIFAGQSNMQGQTEALPFPNEPVADALEYRHLTDSLVPLMHPVGETIADDTLSCAELGCGSLIPDFCRAYIRHAGVAVTAIHTARGATRIDEWLKGTARYDLALEKIRAGIAKTRAQAEVRRICLVWLQGESDAIYRTTEEEYIARMRKFRDDLVREVGIAAFGIIEVGWFCSTVRWMTDRTHEDALACDATIMRAQERLCREEAEGEIPGRFVLLTQLCKALSLDNTYINPDADGHYNNRAMALIGTDAAHALARV